MKSWFGGSHTNLTVNSITLSGEGPNENHPPPSLLSKEENHPRSRTLPFKTNKRRKRRDGPRNQRFPPEAVCFIIILLQRSNDQERDKKKKSSERAGMDANFYPTDVPASYGEGGAPAEGAAAVTEREPSRSPLRSSASAAAAAGDVARERLGRNGEDGTRTMTPMTIPQQWAAASAASASASASMPPPAAAAAAAAAGGRFHHATEPDQISRASSSDGNSNCHAPHLRHDSRPNLKKENSDNSSTLPFSGIGGSGGGGIGNQSNHHPHGGGAGNGMEYHHLTNMGGHPGPRQSSEIAPRSSHERNSHTQGGNVGLDFERSHHDLRAQPGPNQVRVRQHELRQEPDQQQQQQQQGRHPGFSDADLLGHGSGGGSGYPSNDVANSHSHNDHNHNNSHNHSHNNNVGTGGRPVVDLRPPPRAGIPQEPPAQSVEPSIPPARLGRRCLTTEKPHRQPDKATGKIISPVDGTITDDGHGGAIGGNGTSNIDGGNLSTSVAVGAAVRIECPGCGTALQVPRGTIVVECPHCQGVYPTVTCRTVLPQLHMAPPLGLL